MATSTHREQPPGAWMEQADEDLAAAEHLLTGSYYRHASVLAHLAIEKALKGLYRDRMAAAPPVTHDLVYLAGRIDLALTSDLHDALSDLNRADITALYADQLLKPTLSGRADRARERLTGARLLMQHIRAAYAAGDTGAVP